jgi:hypothetical protein
MPSATIIISALAVILAVVHIIFPSVAIDTTTLLLLGVAALPWLAPILKSFKLPGGVEVVLRDIEGKIENVQARVHENAEQVQILADKVERYVFSGDTAPPIEQQVSVLLNDFRSYLVDLGIAVPPTAPAIRIDKALRAGYYDGTKGEMVLGADLASDWMVLRQYCNHVLISAQRDNRLSLECRAVQSGLAYYFPCSYKDLIPEIDASLEGARITDVFASNKEAVPPTDFVRRELAVGIAWLKLLWKVRDRVGKRNTDKACALAWTNLSSGSDCYSNFANKMLEALDQHVESHVMAQITALLVETGLVLKAGAASKRSR